MEVVVAEDCSTTELAAEDPEEVESEVKLGRVELSERDDSVSEARRGQLLSA